MVEKIEFKYLNLCGMLYFMLMILANVVIFRITKIDNIKLSVGTIVIPCWYLVGDVITEVYGYKNMRSIIWFSLICTGLFSIFVDLLVNLPNATVLSNAKEYHEIFSPMPHVFVGMVLAVFIGTFLNSFLISKWKVLISGRLFCLRSLGSSTIGQFFFTFIAMSFDLFHVVTLAVLMKLIFTAYIIKFFLTPIAAVPAAFLAQILKKAEGVEVYDFALDYSPFRLS